MLCIGTEQTARTVRGPPDKCTDQCLQPMPSAILEIEL